MFFKRLDCILPLIMVLALLSCDRQKKVKEKTGYPPNIIYILADDLGYGDLSCYGQTKFNTPNIDALATGGLKFTQHYAGCTVCAPSRSVLLTGLHTGHTPIRGNKEVYPEGQYPLPDSILTLPKLFKKVGYTTGIFGKWGLGFPNSEGDPLNQGFDSFFGYNCQRLGHHYYPHYLRDGKNQVFLQKNQGNAKGTYAPSLIHEKTLDFITQNKDTPFFLFVASIIPHAELSAPQSYMNSFKGKFGEETPYKGIDAGKNFRKGPYQSQQQPKAAFAAMVKMLDDQVGEIVQKIKSLGLENRTLIIFTSDNGPHMEGGANPVFFDSNGPFRGYKRDLYEGGIRVPMIAYWPTKIKPNTTTNHISAFWDVLPTISEITGQEIAGKTDGISFLPTLLNRSTQKQHDYLYWEFHEMRGRQAVRKGNFKAVRYHVLENPDSEVALYDLSKDIEESVNIASQHPDIVREMDSILKAARTPSPVFTFSSSTYLQE